MEELVIREGSRQERIAPAQAIRLTMRVGIARHKPAETKANSINQVTHVAPTRLGLGADSLDEVV